jgi:hypothetical protein
MQKYRHEKYILENLSQYLQIIKYRANIFLSLSITNTNMAKHIKESREFIALRGQMVAFLLSALAVTGWINNFQEPINESLSAYIQDTIG